MVVDRSAERLLVVGRDEPDPRQQRLEILPVPRLAGYREGTERAAVKRVLERHDVVLLGVDLPSVRPDHLQRAFHGLGSGVAEEGALETADLGQALGQRSLVLVVEVVRGVDEQAGLLAEHPQDARVAVAQRVDADAGEQIEVALAAQIEHVASLAPVEHQRVAGIGREHIASLQIHDLLCCGNRFRIGRHFLMIQTR